MEGKATLPSQPIDPRVDLEIEKMPSPLQGALILYIEDDQAMRRMFRMVEATLLKPYTFSFAETLAAAASELKLNPKKYSAIISDYHLPDGEAKDLFPIPFDLPVIMLTGTYDVDLAVALMKLGVDDFLVKDKEMHFLRLIPEKIKSVIDKKRIKKEVAQQERRFRDLFENSNDIILYLGEEGKILQTSPQLTEILGYDNKDREALTIMDMVHPDDRPRYQALLATLSPGQKFDDVEVRLLSKAGKVFVMEANASKSLMDEGHYYTRAIFRDVTEKKKSEQMIRKQNIDLAEKNKQINEGLIKLRKATVSNRASAIVFALAVALFLISEFWLEPFFIQYSGSTHYNWMLKIIIVLLLKPFDMLIERWLLRQKIKDAGLA
jgi:PAS domain S-box-containing protein